MKNVIKKRAILQILHDPKVDKKHKLIAWEKWKWNQLPDWYRKQNINTILQKLHEKFEVSDSENLLNQQNEFDLLE